MPAVLSNGIVMHYERQGEGKPFVTITGLGYGGWFWHRLVPHLAPHFEVVTFDNRGSGQTDKPAGPYTIAMLAADTAGLLDALDIRGAVVFGHSLGGLIAQELIWSRPDLASKLILGGTLLEPPRACP